MLTNLTPLIISVLLRAVVEIGLVDSAYAREHVADKARSGYYGNGYHSLPPATTDAP